MRPFPDKMGLAMVLTDVTDELLTLFDRRMSVAVLTEAGVSAESGVPTFRVRIRRHQPARTRGRNTAPIHQGEGLRRKL
ncbi:MAG: hypothetical protein L0229_24595 [Blastocatellia bacterium]|nr:hypothetical protein [Blastocatellia bacterium]